MKKLLILATMLFMVLATLLGIWCYREYRAEENAKGICISYRDLDVGSTYGLDVTFYSDEEQVVGTGYVEFQPETKDSSCCLIDCDVPEGATHASFNIVE